MKRSMVVRCGTLVIGLMTFLPGWSADGGTAPAAVAGLSPDARPAGAPVVKAHARAPEQAARSTAGIEQPFPKGIGFLKHQGAWYTPFSAPGMVSYYDVRGWHRERGEGKAPGNDSRLLRAEYSPLHFKPAIETAKDEDCLACHREVLEDRVRNVSPAGLKAADAKAWYQRGETYSGEQDTFHRRHLVTDLAKQVMNLKCNTCHQGSDPREEAPGASATSTQKDDNGFTLRKQVNPETSCLKCHGQMNWQAMGLPSPWSESKTIFQNNCLLCHAGIRTNRHQVSYLNAAKIEELGAKTSDTCYGCHGGRAWYRISYPYPRNPWEGMSPDVPEWAKNRPTQSEARFRLAK